MVEGTFGPEFANATFAALHDRWPFRALQIHCTAPDSVLLVRYAARATSRHHGHLDASIGSEVADSLRQGRRAPLTLPGECTEIDTTTFETDWYAGALQRARELVSA